MHSGKRGGGGGGNARPFRWILNPHQEFGCVLALNLQPAICLRALAGTRNYDSRSLVGSRPTNPPTFEECGSEALGRCRFSKLRSAPGMLVRPQVRKKDRPIYESTAASQIPGLAVSVHDIVSEDCRRQVNRKGRTLDGQWQHALYSKLQRNGSGWVSLVRHLTTNLPDQNACKTARMFRLWLHAFINKMRASERVTDPRRWGQYIQSPGSRLRTRGVACIQRCPDDNGSPRLSAGCCHLSACIVIRPEYEHQVKH